MRFHPIKTLAKSIGICLVSAALAFFTGNLIGIITLAVYQLVTHHKPDYANAYRYFGVPFGFTAMFVAFVTVWVLDIREASRT
jgi:hypothetical protein